MRKADRNDITPLPKTRNGVPLAVPEPETDAGYVRIPAAHWAALLRLLAAANQETDDLLAGDLAIRTCADFLDTVEAIRKRGITRPLRQHLALLPLLRKLVADSPGTCSEALNAIIQFMAEAVPIIERLNQALEEIGAVRDEPGASTLEKGGTQIGVMMAFVEDATGGRIIPILTPAREVFDAVHDRTQGIRSKLLFASPGAASKHRVRDLERAHLAAAADVLITAGLRRPKVLAWWGDRAQARKALRWRDEVNAGTAPPLLIGMFRELRPMPRQSIARTEAERLATQWRKVVAHRKVVS